MEFNVYKLREYTNNKIRSIRISSFYFRFVYLKTRDALVSNDIRRNSFTNQSVQTNIV